MNKRKTPWPEVVPVPETPLDIALVGAGNRSRSIYAPIFPSLEPWLRVVAVCDPIAEHREKLASEIGARPYADIRDLVRDAPMEAAIVVTPVPSHHAISVFLSAHGFHNAVETSMCATLGQGRNMIKAAKNNGVVLRVAENFFRFAIDRFAQTVRDNGHIGRIGRIVSYADHTGFHNNSRWLVFAGCNPSWVQSAEHTIETKKFRSMPHRYHETETFRGKFIQFENGFFVSDQAANIKGFLGRHQRPGYTEWQGTRGALVYRAANSTRSEARYYENGEVRTVKHESRMGSATETELRYSSQKEVDKAGDRTDVGGGTANEISPVTHAVDSDGLWTETFCETSAGTIRYINPFRVEATGLSARLDYGVAIMDHLVDFVLQIKGLRDSEYLAEDALTSLTIEAAARESAKHEGKRVELPLKNESEVDAESVGELRAKYGFDPLEVDGMISYSYARP